MDKRLADKVAIVTGAGSGVGEATARLLHVHGAKVIATDFSGNQDRTAADLGKGAAAFRADLSSEADLARLVDFAVNTFGQLDILCNVGAATSTKEFLADAHVEDFDRIVSINLRSVFLTMKFAIPHMIARGGGSIVNVASTAAIRAWPKMTAYSAAKAGVIAMTKVAAAEYGPDAIRANVVVPGATETPMLIGQYPEDPGRLDTLRGMSPLRRLGQPSELASAILFFASDESSYVSGTVLPVDGGQSM